LYFREGKLYQQKAEQRLPWSECGENDQLAKGPEKTHKLIKMFYTKPVRVGTWLCIFLGIHWTVYWKTVSLMVGIVPHKSGLKTTSVPLLFNLKIH
jgi:hypothetical protein